MLLFIITLIVISFQLIIAILRDIVLDHQCTWFTLLQILGLVLVLISAKQVHLNHGRQLSNWKKQIDSTEQDSAGKGRVFSALLANIPCAIATISPDYCIRSVNAELISLTGVIEMDIVGKQCFHVFGSGHMCPNCPVERAFQSGTIEKNVKVEINRKEKEIYIEQIAIPVLDSAGGIEYVLEVVVDATEKVGLQRQHDNLLIQTITSLVNLIESRDKYTGFHSNRVRDIAFEMGKELGFKAEELEEISIAAVLHDIGKIGSPEHILNKPGSLTAEEYEVIKEHPRIGYNALYKVDSLKQVANIILDHHERVDGQGYPTGKKTEEISLSTKILSVADVYEAMTADRIYRRAMSEETAINIINDGRGTQFDPLVVDALLKMVARQNIIKNTR